MLDSTYGFQRVRGPESRNLRVLAFDVLLHLAGENLMPQPYLRRRERLERLLGEEGLGPPWTLCPMTLDRAEVERWMRECTGRPPYGRFTGKSGVTTVCTIPCGLAVPRTPYPVPRLRVRGQRPATSGAHRGHREAAFIHISCTDPCPARSHGKRRAWLHSADGY